MRHFCFAVTACGWVTTFMPAAPAVGDHILGLDSLTYVVQDRTVDTLTNSSYVVGFANKTDYHDRVNGVAATLTLTENAIVHSAAAYNGSVINSSGTMSSPAGGLGAGDGGTANLVKGFVYFLQSVESGTANATGGRANYARFSGSSTGSIGNIVLGNANETFVHLQVSETSTVTLTGTQVFDQVMSLNAAHITALGGTTIGGHVTARNASQIDLIGATLGRDLIAQDTATINGSVVDVTGSVLAQGQLVSLDASTVAGAVLSSGNSAVALSGVTVATDVSLNGAGNASIIAGTVQGNVVKGQFGDLSVSGGEIFGSLTSSTWSAQTSLVGATIGGNVVVRQGLVDGTEIAGNLSNSGGPIQGVFPTLTVSGATAVAGDLLADSRGEILFGGGEVAGNAVIGGLGTMTVSGGIIRGDLSCGNYGTITGGTVMKNLNVDVGFITMSGGQIDGDVNVGAGSFSMSNGTVAGSAEVGTGSVVQIGGGTIGKGINLGETASAFLTGGTVTGDVSAPTSGTVEVNGATVTGNVFLDQAVTASVKSGEVKGDITVRGTSKLDVSGGAVSGIGVGDFASASMSGGEVLKNFVAIENANVQIVDGVIGGGVGAKGHATVDLFGGRVEGFETGGDPLGLFATDFGTINVAGGAQIHSGAEAAQVAELNLNSGKIIGDLKLTGGASAKVGAEFEITQDVWGEDTAGFVLEGGHVGRNISMTGARTQFSITDGAVDGITTISDGVASITGGTLELGLFVFGSGHASITGGTVKGNVDTWGTAVVTLSGGSVPDHGFQSGVTASDASRLFIAGGTVDVAVKARDSSTITITGGVIEDGIVLRNDVEALDTAKVIVTGGDLRDNLEAHLSGELLLAGGDVRENLFGDDNSVTTMTGGRVAAFAVFQDNAKFIYKGGTIGGGVIENAATAGAARPIGGLLGDGLYGSTEAIPLVAHLTGSPISIEDNALLSVVGFDLEALLVDPSYQQAYSLYQLAGMLADGTPVTGQYFAVQNGTGAGFELVAAVPEPAGAALVLVVMAWWAVASRADGRRRAA